MSEQIIKKASEIIKNRTVDGKHVGAGTSLTLIDNDGYPTTSCVSMTKADGMREILFGGGLSSNRFKRVQNCSLASINLFDDDYEGGSYYNITLVGDIEIVTDPDVKKSVWHKMYEEHFEGGINDPDFAVLRFTTKRYNIWVDMGDELKGSFDSAPKKSPPRFEPILVFTGGSCAEAMELYEKAFGAVAMDVTTYGESDPTGDLAKNPAAKDWIMNAQMAIGKQTILVCDDATNDTKIGNHIQIVLEFDTAEEVERSYNAMLDGATNLTPPHNAGYSPCVAYVTDKFGIPWQMMVWL